MLFGGYDRSSSTWALHADIHCHIFLEIKANQLDKDMVDIASYYLTYESSLASDALLNDDISFFVVCCQMFSLETETVPYLYRCWVWVNQIMTYKINKLYLVVHSTLTATFWVGSVV